MTDYIPAIPKWFATRRAAQVTAFFAIKSGGKINILKAVKLIYLADRASMESRDYPITGDNFVSMEFGPVNSITYNYMKGLAPVRQEMWAEFVGSKNQHYIPIAVGVGIDDLDELSRADLEILDSTWNKFKDIDQFTLADWTHKYCPEWRDPSGSSIPIEFATVFKHLNKMNPVELAEEIQSERAFSASLMAE